MKRPSLVIVGAGGHGGCLCDVAELAGFSVTGFIDTERSPGDEALGRPILGGDERLDDEAFLRAHAFGLGIGDPGARRRYGRRLKAAGAALPAIVNPSAFVSAHARLGDGVLLMGLNAVNHQARLEDFVVLDWHATVGHHTVVGEAAFLGPGVHVGGRARVGEQAYLGIGSQVVHEVAVGGRTVIGAGATVTRDLPDRVLAVGTPAVVKKTLPPGSL